jgi:hypothetical protein
MGGHYAQANTTGRLNFMTLINVSFPYFAALIFFA